MNMARMELPVDNNDNVVVSDSCFGCIGTAELDSCRARFFDQPRYNIVSLSSAAIFDSIVSVAVLEELESWVSSDVEFSCKIAFFSCIDLEIKFEDYFEYSSSTLTSLISGLDSASFPAADSYSGARDLQWPHHGASRIRFYESYINSPSFEAE